MSAIQPLNPQGTPVVTTDSGVPNPMFGRWLAYINSLLSPPDALAKAWVSVTGATGAILASYNIASVVRTVAGSYTVTFTAPFASANFAAVATSTFATSISTKTASSIVIQTYSSITGTLADFNFDLVCFGRQ